MPKFDKFIIFPWSPIIKSGEQAEKRLEGIKECGFNASCFVNKSDYDTCRRLGLEIYSELDKNNCATKGLDYKKVIFDYDCSDEEVRKVMYAAMETIPEDVRSIYVDDEPGASHFKRLGLMAECVREKFPNAEAYINLFPNYAVCGAPNISQLEAETYEEYVERFAVETKPDSIGYDNYQVIMSNNFRSDYGRVSYFNNLLQAREVCDKYDIPFQSVGCCNQLRANLTIPTLGNLAFQAYTALAAGAKALSWFIYFGLDAYFFSPIDDTTNEDIKTPTWYLLREVNRRVLPLGEELINMDFKGMYFTKTDGLKEGARSISECSAIKSFSSNEDCMIGHYVDKEGRDVILVANCSATNSTSINIDLGGELQSFNTERLGWFKPLLVNTRGKTSPIWLEPGCGIALRV